MRNVKVTFSMDVKSVLKGRGMGASSAAQEKAVGEVKRLSDPYVPFRTSGTGALKNTVTTDGESLTYNAPYARYHWYGKVMGPNVRTAEGTYFSPTKPKHLTDRDMTYSGAPTRGPRWTERMFLERRDELLRSIAVVTGGEPV